MSSRLQSYVRNLSLWRCHLANSYEVKAGIGVTAGNFMPEHLECEVLQKVRYINALTYLPTVPHFLTYLHCDVIYLWYLGGELRDKYGRAFKFDVYDDRRKNQDRYERFGEVVSFSITCCVFKTLQSETVLSTVSGPLTKSVTTGIFPINDVRR